MQNKRRFPRLALCVRVEYKVLDPDKLTSLKVTKTKDIAVAGIRMHTPKETLAKDTYLDLKFYLPKDKAPIEAIGKVVWTSGKEAGIEFLKISYPDQERISNLMSKLIEKGKINAS